LSPRTGHRNAWNALLIAGAAALLSVLLLPAAALADEEEGQVSIHGRIIDGTGTGVAGQVVRLLKSRTYLKIGGLRSLDQSAEDARATTDALGFFEIATRRDAAFPYYYLRFYDPKTFDSVQYRLPEDREISKKVRSGRPVQISVSLQFQPDWPKVKTAPAINIRKIATVNGLGRLLASEEHLAAPSGRREAFSGTNEIIALLLFICCNKRQGEARLSGRKKLMS